MLHRRLTWGRYAATAVALALALSACGASEDDDEANAGSDSDAFPVEVTHARGTATIEKEPERVVVLGSADTQIASALDLPIVGAVRDPSSEDGNWPGTETPLSADVLALDSTEPNLEQIAALEPDVILATSAQPSYNEMYDELSEVAPVISYKTAPLQDSGEDLVRLIGEATGESAAAEELISASDEAIEGFTEEFPGLADTEYVFGQYAGGTTYLVASPTALSTQFMSRLGMVIPDEVSELWNDDDDSYAGSLGMITPSNEQLDLLDSADVAFISAYGDNAAEEFTAIPLIASLDLLKSDRLNMIEQDLAAPLLQPNPATTSYLLDRLRPYAEQITAADE